ncbi:MAG: type II CAAX endopeptidase family protein [Lachnospiraceae bacterium]|nr:type II CAAX endopeptidase family protein [Lachnospiraceae bacterium]
MKNRRKHMSDKCLLLFFVLTLLWTWICGFIPVIFDFTGTPAGTFLFYFGGGTPSVVALFFVFLTYSKEKRKDYFRRCFSFKYMGWKWPLITICVFSAITIISLSIGVGLLKYDMPTMDFMHAIIDNPIMLLLVLLISLISGPLNEEFGWRGYALDKLLLRFGFWGASTILGFIWGIWHLPWYFTPGQAQYNLLQDSVFHAIMFIPSVMMLSSFVTFVYIKTKRSILAGALVHMFSNLIGSQLLSSYSTEISMIIRYANMVFFAIIMLYVFFSKKFENEVEKQIATIKEYEEKM